MLKYHIRVPVILVKITVFAWSIMAHTIVIVHTASVVPTAKITSSVWLVMMPCPRTHVTRSQFAEVMRFAMWTPT
ncbi:hypothetical protein DPMN_032936 [Dreissena polymorpha]|uniref:Uncharacterized protein n=1 Tax=Dreissena polymorpha TaxID=45954 RepID=A0A9D4M558_DREPO|nr:hypothetical protein DPMN_032936 [Dreissena polymorpha]